MKYNYITLLLFIFSFIFSNQAQKKNKILLEHGFLHVGNGQVIESALIGIEDGKITLVRNSLAYTYNKKDWDTIIDLNGQHIYPGFIAPNSTLGLTEIDGVKATHDYLEVGEFNPHIRTQIAYNAESDVISTVRTNGVLISQATPRGGIISGTSSIMKLNGWNWEDATLLKEDGIHLNWPINSQKEHLTNNSTHKNSNYEEEKTKITDFFKLAKTYSESSEHEKIDIRLEAMKDCFQGTKRIYIHANYLQELLDIINFSKEFNIQYPVIVGGQDSYLITQKLKDAKIPIMISRLHNLPHNEDDAIDLTYKLPYLLHEGGVKFCLQNEGDMEAMNSRNLPFLAGTAKAYGLTEEQAIQSVSLSSSEIIGISEKYGSIEIGKNATLFISEGNALDMRTNKISLVLINGEFVEINNRQKALFKKYSDKYKK